MLAGGKSPPSKSHELSDSDDEEEFFEAKELGSDSKPKGHGQDGRRESNQFVAPDVKSDQTASSAVTESPSANPGPAPSAGPIPISGPASTSARSSSSSGAAGSGSTPSSGTPVLGPQSGSPLQPANSSPALDSAASSSRVPISPALIGSSPAASVNSSPAPAKRNSNFIKLPAPPDQMSPDAENEQNIPYIVRNLDTGETCRLEEAPQKFPELQQAALTLKQLDSAIANSGASHDPERRESELDLKVNANELEEKKKTLGFFSKIKQALGGGGAEKGDNGPSGKPGKLTNSIKSKTHDKEKAEFQDLRLVQSINVHNGPIWTVCVSPDGNYIATGGQDSIVRVWCVHGSAAEKEMETRKANEAKEKEGSSVSGSSSGHVPASAQEQNEVFDPHSDAKNPGVRYLLNPEPYRSYSGHKADVIDLAFSKANFLLSASIDKTVRLWHVSRQKCLCLFQHADFVTAVAFHPIEDKYFVSGSFDQKLRIWNIPEHRVVEWAQTANIITAAAFSPSGQMVVAGFYNGHAVFYQTEGLKYFTQVDCKNRHGKNRKGKKVTGIQFSADGKQLLVSTNDSRIRLYDMEDYSMLAKFKGALNDELQIRAHFSEDGKHIICGSENECVYVWNCEQHINKQNKSNSPAKDDSYEYFKATNNTVTCAQFLPKSFVRIAQTKLYEHINQQLQLQGTQSSGNNQSGASTPAEDPTQDPHNKIAHLMVASGYNGELRLFENRAAPLKSGYKSLTRSQIRSLNKPI